MNKLLISALFTLAIAAPSVAQVPTQLTTEVRTQTLRPNKEDNISVKQSIRYGLNKDLTGTFSAGWQRYFPGEDDARSIVPLRLSVENRPPRGAVSIKGTVGIDLIESQKDQIFAAITASVPMKDAKLSGTITTASFLGSSKAIAEGLRRLEFESRLTWKIDPKTNLLVAYVRAFYTDGNWRDIINFRLQYDLGSGFYIAGTAFYANSKEESELDYWTPNNRFAVGPEFGYRFALSKKTGCQIGVRPVFKREDRRNSDEVKTDFQVPFGAGCKIGLNQKADLLVDTRAGNGLNTRVQFNQRF